MGCLIIISVGLISCHWADVQKCECMEGGKSEKKAKAGGGGRGEKKEEEKRKKGCSWNTELTLHSGAEKSLNNIKGTLHNYH